MRLLPGWVVVGWDGDCCLFDGVLREVLLRIATGYRVSAGFVDLLWSGCMLTAELLRVCTWFSTFAPSTRQVLK